ncbi:MAG: hypothetical protein JJE03_01040 [Peptostreptococcaceae bacterium]|nr:hypothetical protein [Peptostreptococcaceae bacterium]
MSQIFETAMLLCFGASWPLALVKNYKARTAKAISLPFLTLITFGYICGISAKIADGNYTYVFWVYIFNITLLILNLMVYARNSNLDKGIETNRGLRKTA